MPHRLRRYCRTVTEPPRDGVGRDVVILGSHAQDSIAHTSTREKGCEAFFAQATSNRKRFALFFRTLRVHHQNFIAGRSRRAICPEVMRRESRRSKRAESLFARGATQRDTAVDRDYLPGHVFGALGAQP